MPSMVERGRDHRVIVLGLGGLGSGALYWLARRLGDEVLGIEQFDLGHDRGGSHDHSRIIRYSYHRRHYVELAKRAYDAWRELEDDAGATLVHRIGGLDLFPEGGQIPLDDYSGSLEAAEIEFELIDSAEIVRRWPQFHRLTGVTGLFQRDGGLVAAARATAAHQELARWHGAGIVSGCAIERVRPLGDEVEVTTSTATYRCHQLVVAAGAWSNQVLADFGAELPLTVTQEQVSYFESEAPEAFAPDRFPVWIWMDDPCFYGFPLFGEPAVKVAQDVGGQEVSVETRSFDPNATTLERTRSFVAKHLPQALGPVHLNKTCLYTLTPDRDFVVDRLSGNDRILLLVGAGHAFKFASILGRIASELVVDGSTPSDLRPFSADRPILHEENPERSFMV